MNCRRSLSTSDGTSPRDPFDEVDAFRAEVARRTTDTLELVNGVALSTYPCRPAALRGLRACVVCIDELTLSENDFPTARAHSTVLSLESTPAIVASFKPLVARASFAGGGPPKTPVALDDRGFLFARTISRKRVARLTARMMTGPAQLDGWSENCGFTGSATPDSFLHGGFLLFDPVR